MHFPPYLFEAFLFQPVDDVRGTAKVGNGVACFSLPKKIQGMWEQLMITTCKRIIIILIIIIITCKSIMELIHQQHSACLWSHQ